MLTDGLTPHENDVIDHHFNYLDTLMKKGTLVLAGRTLNNDPSTFGIVIFVAENEESARDIVANDPAVKEGVMTAELFPYRIALIAERNAQA